jgi:hypothetical protein
MIVSSFGGIFLATSSFMRLRSIIRTRQSSGARRELAESGLNSQNAQTTSMEQERFKAERSHSNAENARHEANIEGDGLN